MSSILNHKVNLKGVTLPNGWSIVDGYGNVFTDINQWHTGLGITGFGYKSSTTLFIVSVGYETDSVLWADTSTGDSDVRKMKSWATNSTIQTTTIPGMGIATTIDNAVLDFNSKENTDAYLAFKEDNGITSNYDMFTLTREYSLGCIPKGKWHMPAAGHANIIFNYRTLLKEWLIKIGRPNRATLFTNYGTFSSTQYSSSYAWRFWFSNSEKYYYPKNYAGFIIPVAYPEDVEFPPIRGNLHYNNMQIQFDSSYVPPGAPDDQPPLYTTYYNYITLDLTKSDPATMLSGDINGSVVQWIRNNSHRVLGKYTADNTITYTRLLDSNSNKYADGSDAILTGDQGDVFMKLPVFYWQCVEQSDDVYQIGLAYGKDPGNGWYKWDGDKTLLGVYQARLEESSGSEMVNVYSYRKLFFSSDRTYVDTGITPLDDNNRYTITIDYDIPTGYESGVLVDCTNAWMGFGFSLKNDLSSGAMFWYLDINGSQHQLNINNTGTLILTIADGLVNISYGALNDGNTYTTSFTFNPISNNLVLGANTSGGSASYYGNGTVSIAILKLVSTISKLYSHSNVGGSTNLNQANLKQFARNRGNGFSLVTWEWHNIMALLYYCKYGNTNSLLMVGTNVSASSKASGRSNSLGMTDTVGNGGNGDTLVVNFWGLEDWWGGLYEKIDNFTKNTTVVDGLYVLNYEIASMGSNTTRNVTSLGVVGGGRITKMLLGDHFDIIPTEVSLGDLTTDYCDYCYSNAAVISTIAHRSGYANEDYAGISFISTTNTLYETSAYATSRIAFYGKLIRIDADTYKDQPIGHVDDTILPVVNGVVDASGNIWSADTKLQTTDTTGIYIYDASTTAAYVIATGLYTSCPWSESDYATTNCYNISATDVTHAKLDWDSVYNTTQASATNEVNNAAYECKIYSQGYFGEGEWSLPAAGVLNSINNYYSAIVTMLNNLDALNLYNLFSSSSSEFWASTSDAEDMGSYWSYDYAYADNPRNATISTVTKTSFRYVLPVKMLKNPVYSYSSEIAPAGVSIMNTNGIIKKLEDWTSSDTYDCMVLKYKFSTTLLGLNNIDSTASDDIYYDYSIATQKSIFGYDLSTTLKKYSTYSHAINVYSYTADTKTLYDAVYDELYTSGNIDSGAVGTLRSGTASYTANEFTTAVVSTIGAWKLPSAGILLDVYENLNEFKSALSVLNLITPLNAGDNRMDASFTAVLTCTRNSSYVYWVKVFHNDYNNGTASSTGWTNVGNMMTPEYVIPVCAL